MFCFRLIVGLWWLCFDCCVCLFCRFYFLFILDGVVNVLVGVCLPLTLSVCVYFDFVW